MSISGKQPLWKWPLLLTPSTKSQHYLTCIVFKRKSAAVPGSEETQWVGRRETDQNTQNPDIYWSYKSNNFHQNLTHHNTTLHMNHHGKPCKLLGISWQWQLLTSSVFIISKVTISALGSKNDLMQLILDGVGSYALCNAI